MYKNIQLAILGSGNGTNAQRIAEHFSKINDIDINCIIYNKKDAYIAQRAQNLGITAQYFNRKDFFESDNVLRFLQDRKVDYVVLAGFLLLVPENLLKAYPNKIVNIHPALLPNYGGKGMYGERVHEAVIAHHEKESGITIHVVDNHYDKGTTLFQAKCEITDSDTPDTLAQKIHKLEHQYFPIVIEKFVRGEYQK